MFDFLIVGAGFAGSVIAERLATQAGKKVLLAEIHMIIMMMAVSWFINTGRISFIPTAAIYLNISDNLRNGVRTSTGSLPVWMGNWYRFP